MADSSSGLRVLGPEFEDENEEENEKPKLDMEVLMEHLRQKKRRKHQKSWNDTVKVLKLSISDKRGAGTFDEPVRQKNLDALQKALHVTSLSLMQERLESMTRAVGLKFSASATSSAVSSVGVASTVYYLSATDAFYVELHMEGSTGRCCQAKICTASSEPVPCSEMVSILNTGRFDEFQQHLKGLSDMFLGIGDKKLSHKVQTSLQALEIDLTNVSKLQSSISSVTSYIHKSPVGIVVPRVGGKPMKLIYFVGPYDLLIEKTKTTCPMTVEAIVENKVGYYVTLEAESSQTQHKLQTLPLMSVSKDGKGMPQFSNTTQLNSHSLPAVYVLKLHKPLPLAWSAIQEIQEHTGIDFVTKADLAPLTSLIVQQVTEDEKARKQADKVNIHKDGEEATVDKGLQKLPNQKQAFFMSCSNGHGALLGALVTRIPFTHPTRVPPVIQALRQQALFNTLTGSCVRTQQQHVAAYCHNNNSITEGDAYTFELTADSLQHITVSFEHPLKEAIATAELDLNDITSIKCKLGASAEGETICSDDYATKVLQRCLSIPVCMRAVLRSKEEELRKQVQAAMAAATPPPPPKYRQPPPPPPLTHRPPLMHRPLLLPPPRSPAAPPLPPPGGLPQPPGPQHPPRYQHHPTPPHYSPHHQQQQQQHYSPHHHPQHLQQHQQQQQQQYPSVSTTPPQLANNNIAPPYGPTPLGHYPRGGAPFSPSPSRSPHHHNAPPVSQHSSSHVQLSDEVLERSYQDPQHAPLDVLEAIKQDKISKNPMLASLLDQSASPNGSPGMSDSSSSQTAPPTSMLSELLGDPNGTTGLSANAAAAVHNNKQQQQSQYGPTEQHKHQQQQQNQYGIDPTSANTMTSTLHHKNKPPQQQQQHHQYPAQQQQQQQHPFVAIDPNAQHPTGDEPPKPATSHLTTISPCQPQPQPQPPHYTQHSLQGVRGGGGPVASVAAGSMVGVLQQQAANSTQARSPVGLGTTQTIINQSPKHITKGATNANANATNAVVEQPVGEPDLILNPNATNFSGSASSTGPHYSNISSVQSLPRTPASSTSTTSSHQLLDPFDFPEQCIGGNIMDEDNSSAMMIDSSSSSRTTPPLLKHKQSVKTENKGNKKDRVNNSRKIRQSVSVSSSPSLHMDSEGGKPPIKMTMSLRGVDPKARIIATTPTRETASPTMPHKKPGAGGGKDLKLLKPNNIIEDDDDDDEDDDNYDDDPDFNFEEEAMNAVVDLTDDCDLIPPINPLLVSRHSSSPTILPTRVVVHQHHQSNKRSASSLLEAEIQKSKRRKSSKHTETESRAEKKRKKLEESKRQESLYKKQKIYDFDDFGDDDPFSVEPQQQQQRLPRKSNKHKQPKHKPQPLPVVQLSSANVLMPQKSSKSSPSSHAPPPLKVLKQSGGSHERTSSPKLQQRTYSRSNSKSSELSQQQHGSAATITAQSSNYKDIKLKNPPTVRLMKTLNVPNSSCSVTVSTPNNGKTVMSSPMSIPVSRAVVVSVQGSSSPMQPPTSLPTAFSSSSSLSFTPTPTSMTATATLCGSGINKRTEVLSSSSSLSSVSSSPTRTLPEVAPSRKSDIVVTTPQQSQSSVIVSTSGVMMTAAAASVTATSASSASARRASRGESPLTIVKSASSSASSSPRSPSTMRRSDGGVGSSSSSPTTIGGSGRKIEAALKKEAMNNMKAVNNAHSASASVTISGAPILKRAVVEVPMLSIASSNSKRPDTPTSRKSGSTSGNTSPITVNATTSTNSKLLLNSANSSSSATAKKLESGGAAVVTIVTSGKKPEPLQLTNSGGGNKKPEALQLTSKKPEPLQLTTPKPRPDAPVQKKVQTPNSGAVQKQRPEALITKKSDNNQLYGSAKIKVDANVQFKNSKQDIIVNNMLKKPESSSASSGSATTKKSDTNNGVTNSASSKKSDTSSVSSSKKTDSALNNKKSDICPNIKSDISSKKENNQSKSGIASKKEGKKPISNSKRPGTVKKRTSSIADAIDKLKKVSQDDIGGAGKQKQYDAVRLEIVKAGNKASGSFSSLPSFNKKKKTTDQKSSETKTDRPKTPENGGKSSKLSNSSPSRQSQLPPNHIKVPIVSSSSSSSQPSRPQYLGKNSIPGSVHRAGSNSRSSSPITSTITPTTPPVVSISSISTSSLSSSSAAKVDVHTKADVVPDAAVINAPPKSILVTNDIRSSSDSVVGAVSIITSDTSGFKKSDSSVSASSKQSGFHQSKPAAPAPETPASPAPEPQVVHPPPPPSKPKVKRMKIDDISERLQGRHFLDIVTKLSPDEGENAEKEKVPGKSTDKSKESQNQENGLSHAENTESLPSVSKNFYAETVESPPSLSKIVAPTPASPSSTSSCDKLSRPHTPLDAVSSSTGVDRCKIIPLDRIEPLERSLNSTPTPTPHSPADSVKSSGAGSLHSFDGGRKTPIPAHVRSSSSSSSTPPPLPPFISNHKSASSSASSPAATAASDPSSDKENKMDTPKSPPKPVPVSIPVVLSPLFAEPESPEDGLVIDCFDGSSPASSPAPNSSTTTTSQRTTTTTLPISSLATTSSSLEEEETTATTTTTESTTTRTSTPTLLSSSAPVSTPPIVNGQVATPSPSPSSSSSKITKSPKTSSSVGVEKEDGEVEGDKKYPDSPCSPMLIDDDLMNEALML